MNVLELLTTLHPTEEAMCAAFPAWQEWAASETARSDTSVQADEPPSSAKHPAECRQLRAIVSALGPSAFDGLVLMRGRKNARRPGNLTHPWIDQTLWLQRYEVPGSVFRVTVHNGRCSLAGPRWHQCETQSEYYNMGPTAAPVVFYAWGDVEVEYFRPARVNGKAYQLEVRPGSPQWTSCAGVFSYLSGAPFGVGFGDGMFIWSRPSEDGHYVRVSEMRSRIPAETLDIALVQKHWKFLDGNGKELGLMRERIFYVPGDTSGSPEEQETEVASPAAVQSIGDDIYAFTSLGRVADPAQICPLDEVRNIWPVSGVLMGQAAPHPVPIYTVGSSVPTLE